MYSDVKQSPLIATKSDHETVKETKEEHPKTKSWMSTLKAIKASITLEPVIALYTMTNMLSELAAQNLKLEKACRVNLNFSEKVCDALSRRDTAKYVFEEREVQILMASVQVWKGAILIAIPCLLIMFIGAWIDKTGRRKVFILTPILGELIRCVALTLNTYFFYELPLSVVVITESLSPALLGGVFTLMLASISYLAHITTVEERSYRVGVFCMGIGLGFPIGTALSGVMLRWIGYYGVFILSSLLYSVCLIYGYFMLEESRRVGINIQTNNLKDISHCIKSFFDVTLVWDTLKIVYEKGENNRRLKVVLLLTCVFTAIGPMHGENSILYLFSRKRFNWSELEFSYFFTYVLITNFLGTAFSISLFSGYLKLDDALLGIISLTSKILSQFVFGFARTTTEIYFAPLVEIFAGTSFTALRSLSTKVIPHDELGRFNSLFSLMEATALLVYAPAYAIVYQITLDVLPGAVFLCGVAMMSPAIFIYVYFYFGSKKRNMKTKENEDLETSIKLLELTKINE